MWQVEGKKIKSSFLLIYVIDNCVYERRYQKLFLTMLKNANKDLSLQRLRHNKVSHK